MASVVPRSDASYVRSQLFALLRKWRNSFELEYKRECKEILEQTSNKSLSSISDSGRALTNLQVKSIDYYWYGSVRIEFALPPNQTTLAFGKGQPVTLIDSRWMQNCDDKLQNLMDKHMFQATLGSVETKSVFVVVTSSRISEIEEQSNINESQWHIIQSFSSLTYEVCEQTIRRLESFASGKCNKMCPEQQKILCCALLVQKEDDYGDRLKIELPKLNRFPSAELFYDIKVNPKEINKVQKEAIQTALTSPRRIHCIQGPPGTGKSTVAAEIVRQCVNNGLSVFACAPSNAAVDSLITRCVRNGFTNIIRLGSPVTAETANRIYSVAAKYLSGDDRKRCKELLQQLQDLRTKLSVMDLPTRHKVNLILKYKFTPKLRKDEGKLKHLESLLASCSAEEMNFVNEYVILQGEYKYLADNALRRNLMTHSDVPVVFGTCTMGGVDPVIMKVCKTIEAARRKTAKQIIYKAKKDAVHTNAQNWRFTTTDNIEYSDYKNNYEISNNEPEYLSGMNGSGVVYPSSNVETRDNETTECPPSILNESHAENRQAKIQPPQKLSTTVPSHPVSNVSKTEMSLGVQSVENEINEGTHQINAKKISYIRSDSIFEDSEPDWLYVEPIDLIGQQLPDASNLPDPCFDVVVVDEAAQATEILVWACALRGKRVILIGDDCQLPPIVRCSGDALFLLEISIVQRLLSIYENSAIPISTMLLKQYRMNRVIMEWPSAIMYGNKLIAASSVEKWLVSTGLDPTIDLRSWNDSFELFTAKGKSLVQSFVKQPLIWVSTGLGSDTLCHDGQRENETSLFNTAEAVVTIALLESLVQQGVILSNVGVIAGYQSQVTLLKKMIDNIGFSHAECKVATVDSFQGQQRDAIILNLVRSNPKGSLGFMNEIRRINVAVTRARKLLIIVGDPKCGNRLPFMGELLKIIDRYNPEGIVPIFDLFDVDKFRDLVSDPDVSQRIPQQEILREKMTRPGSRISESSFEDGWIDDENNSQNNKLSTNSKSSTSSSDGSNDGVEFGTHPLSDSQDSEVASRNHSPISHTPKTSPATLLSSRSRSSRSKTSRWQSSRSRSPRSKSSKAFSPSSSLKYYRRRWSSLTSSSSSWSRSSYSQSPSYSSARSYSEYSSDSCSESCTEDGESTEERKGGRMKAQSRRRRHESSFSYSDMSNSGDEVIKYIGSNEVLMYCSRSNTLEIRPMRRNSAEQQKKTDSDSDDGKE